LVIQAKVDEWRVLRQNTYLIHCSLIGSENRLDILSALPLPYDEELKHLEQTRVKTDLEIYEQGRLIRLPNTHYNG